MLLHLWLIEFSIKAHCNTPRQCIQKPGLQLFHTKSRGAIATTLHLRAIDEKDQLSTKFGVDDFSKQLKSAKVWANNDVVCRQLDQVPLMFHWEDCEAPILGFG